MSVFSVASLPTATTQKQPVSVDGGSTERAWPSCTVDVTQPRQEQNPATYTHSDEPGGRDADLTYMWNLKKPNS